MKLLPTTNSCVNYCFLKVYYLPFIVIYNMTTLGSIIGSLYWYRKVLLKERIQVVHGHSVSSVSNCKFPTFMMGGAKIILGANYSFFHLAKIFLKKHVEALCFFIESGRRGGGADRFCGILDAAAGGKGSSDRRWNTCLFKANFFMFPHF